MERKTGFLQIGKLARHTATETTERTVELIERDRESFTTITASRAR